jgi:glycosyltransferase involved in cell wall biosynthesis
MRSPRIKVVRLLPTLDFGGVESRAILQAELQDRERFDLRVCAFWRDGVAAQKIRALGIQVDILEADPAIRNHAATLALWRYLDRERPDVLHASIAEAMFHGAIAGYAARVPLRIIEEVGRPQRSPLGNLSFAGLSCLVDRVVGVSQVTCDYLIEHDRMIAERVKLIYNCGKPEYFLEPSRARVAGQALRVFTAGRLVPVKNQHMLLEAMSILVHERKLPIQLQIAGDGELAEGLARQIQALSLSAHVELLGFRNDVRALLDQSDVFVLPSHDEGCSVALIEAMASGISVLGSTAGGILEVLGELAPRCSVPAHDVAGWVEALAALATMPLQEREQRGLEGRAIAIARFSPERYIGNVEAMYLEATKKQRS